MTAWPNHPKVIRARFAPGHMVLHRTQGYRALVFDVDACFGGDATDTDDDGMPQRPGPWYHVLVDGAEHSGYAAEADLEPLEAPATIDHPLLGHLFTATGNGRLAMRQRLN
ncbi:heat shock protein HspQ [Yunchengibacter salinarum]|uniref:heat shock protein HspQ n=1 Tax=Yunchengibacter salinarum TaxID=3133399 RepID=UPI0035B65FF0